MSGGSIKSIDRSTVHRICSDQVITDLCSAVKELVENSLDAGATSVEVRLKNCGEESIEVIDNGKGIQPDDFNMVAQKHTTSKLEDFDGLQRLTSFGFRGEALSSLCALAGVEITTRHTNEQVGTVLTLDKMGHVESKKAGARGVGTTISIKELFRGLPVRHQELKRHLKREYSKLLALLNGYGLICTGVRLSVTNMAKSRQTAFTTKGSKNMRDNIIEILGVKQTQQLMEFKCSQDDPAIAVQGFVSKPQQGCGRSTSDRQYFFVNRRPVDLPSISHKINQTYRQYNMSQAPVLVLNFTLPTDSYDVNVTPY